MTDRLPNSNDLLGHYRLIRRIGSGGMGEVYVAEDARLGRKAAVKILQPKIAADAQKMARFIREAKTASALNHPNIITIYEAGVSGGVDFIAAEYIEGKTLHQIIESGQLPITDVVDIALQIASGLAAAHAAGIIHRDIKPENVMVRPDGLVKILDFGIAKLSEEESWQVDAEAATVVGANTSPGVIIGTVNYMSPEQARGQEVGPASDIFSFGTLLYELVTRHQPFAGETTSHTMVAILENEAPPLFHFIRDYPAEIDDIIRRCLSKEPNKRIRASELHEELRSLERKLEFERELRTAQTGSLRVSTLEIPPGAENVKTISNRATPNNLTSETTPLIGRDTEIAVLCDLLADPATRLITLTGIGGTGKTRLAQAVARRSLSLFPDGVYFVDLSSTFDPDLVLATIAARLDLEEARGRPFIDLLTEKLDDKRTLLVIDNFEQVIPAASVLSDLITSCGLLKVIITSRELLNLSLEKEFSVGPLPVPPADLTLADAREAIRQFPSLSLFTERARNANPDFALNSSNLPNVARICTRLDGLPLAIELAAARTRVLSTETLAARLVESLSLLSGGPRDLPERQQTMRGAIRWSYDLLDDRERAFFRRMSVFTGSFDAEATEAVWEGDGEAVDILTSLIEKSLFGRVSGSGDTPRFRMLEVVREFAFEQLKEEAEEMSASKSHARYFLELSEKAEPHIQAAQSAEWLVRLEQDHANIRAALQWSLENEPATAARLAAATRNFWLLHGHLSEGFGWLTAAAGADDGSLPPASRFKLLNALGLISRFLGKHDAARAAYEEALEAGRIAEDDRAVAVANRGLGLLALHDQQYEAANKYFETGLTLSREVGDDFGVAVSLNYLGDVARTEDKNDIARGHFEEALKLLRKLDNKVAVSDNLNNLAAAAFASGDLSGSQKHFAEALTMARELGNKITISISLDGFAAIATRKKNYQRAITLANAAEQLRRSIGYEIEPAENRFRAAYLTELEENRAASTPEKTLELDEAIDLALDNEY